MNFIQGLLFMIALVNLIAISISIYYKRTDISTTLSILEIVIVYFSLTL